MLIVHPEAQAYAEAQGIPLPDLPVGSQPRADDQLQLVRADGLALQLLNQPKMKPLRVDFVSGRTDHRRRFGGGRQQDLARACGLHEKRDLKILDATAGLGRDAFVLASVGARVTLVERHPVIHALLLDGWQRALAQAEGEQGDIIGRMDIVVGEAQTLADLATPDVIYLDPMFPPRDKSAAVKADMQILHVLAGPDRQSEELLAWALTTARCRVAVKRPRTAPTLTAQAPSHQLKGKSNRFDVYTLRRLSG